jgi:putative FmdB family regulatory protein
VDPLRHPHVRGLIQPGGGSSGRIAWPDELCHHSRAVPTYDYQCRSCGSMTEVIHSMLEEGPRVCERCGGELRRVLYPAGIIFKGSGFYRTDSRGNGATSSTEPAAAAGSSTGTAPKGDAPKGDSSKGESASKGDSASGKTPSPTTD